MLHLLGEVPALPGAPEHSDNGFKHTGVGQLPPHCRGAGDWNENVTGPHADSQNSCLEEFPKGRGKWANHMGLLSKLLFHQFWTVWQAPFLFLSVHQTYRTSCIVSKCCQSWIANITHKRPICTNDSYCTAESPQPLMPENMFLLGGSCLKIRAFRQSSEGSAVEWKQEGAGAVEEDAWTWLKSRLWGQWQKRRWITDQRVWNI